MLFCRTLLSSILLNFNTSAVVEIKRSNDPNFLQFIIWLSLVALPVISSPWTSCWSLLLSSDKHSAGSWISSSPVLLLGFPLMSQRGPTCHNTLVVYSSGVILLEGMSAGFSLPGQCLQQVGSISLQISVTRFWTKAFQILSLPLIQRWEILELVEQ